MHVDLTPAQEKLLADVERKFQAAEAGHKRHREQWDRLDALYHARRDFLDAHSSASPRDRDGVIEDGRKVFGEELLIPYAFSVIETILPRMLSNRPRMLWTPRNPASEKNVENVKLICDAQQHKANYELKLQTTGRSGLIYGLGVQKLGWRREEVERKTIVPRVMAAPGEPAYAVRTALTVPWDDPDVEDVSIYDFLWDPYGDCMQNVGYVIHRTWRSTSYVLDKVRSGDWPEIPELDAECLEGGGGKQRYTELWKPRWNAQGKRVDLKEPVHEVWELHDGARVVTVVDRKWPVREVENPAWHGQMPFHIYRPTEILHQFVGKGEVEPIEDLQREMNWLRTDRRWNAAMVMHRAHFYIDGSIDPETVQIGPGSMVPVLNTGIPLNEVLHPVMTGDIANSGYQEEAALQQDIERVSGISEQVSGGTGAEQTATGAQLAIAAAGERIKLKTRRVELELIKPEAEQWLALNQQRITEARHVRFEVPPLPQPGAPERRWAWREIGPEQLAGEFDVVPEGGSTAPENVPQMRADAQMLQAMAAAPGVDQRKLMLRIFEKLGEGAPESLLMPEVRVPPATLDLIANQLMKHLGEMGMDPAQSQPMVEQLIRGSLAEALDMENQGGAGGPPPSDQPQPPERMAA